MQHFDEGNRRFTQGDYRGALEAYHEAEASGQVSGALFYNMGNAYYRLDQLGQAVRYYEKARRLLPDSPELAHNLEIVRARLQDQMSQLPEPFWRPWWRRFVTRFGVGGLFAAGFLLYLTAAAIAGYRIWTGTRSPWLRRGLTVSLSLGLLLVVLAFTASAERRLDRRAVVIATEIGLREAPRAGAPVTTTIHEGLLLDVLQEQDAWLQVRLPNGTTGWIDAQAVGELAMRNEQ